MWQKCPVCNAQVQVLMCRTCKGHGIINELTGLPPANEKPLEKKKKKEKFNYRQYLRESLDNAFNAEINKYLSGSDYDIDHFSLSKNQEELNTESKFGIIDDRIRTFGKAAINQEDIKFWEDYKFNKQAQQLTEQTKQAKQQPLSSTNGQTEIDKLQIAIEVLENSLPRINSVLYKRCLTKYLNNLKAKKDGLLKTKSNN